MGAITYFLYFILGVKTLELIVTEHLRGNITKSSKKLKLNNINFMQHKFKILNNKKILLGQGLHDPIEIELNKDHNSLLICGMKGWGKSSLLRTILLQVLKQGQQLYTIDYKMVELSLFKKHSIKSVIEVDKGILILDIILDLIHHRNSLFSRVGVLDIEEYKNKGYKLKYVCLVIEELALMNKDEMNKLKKIMSIGRSAGINIICTIQRPDAKTLDSYIKSQFDYITSTKMLDKTNSDLIGLPELENIEVKGRFKIYLDGEFKEYQSYYINSDGVRGVLNEIK